MLELHCFVANVGRPCELVLTQLTKKAEVDKQVNARIALFWAHVGRQCVLLRFKSIPTPQFIIQSILNKS